MKNYRVFIVIVIVLVIINCILLGLFWFRPDNARVTGMPPRGAYEYLSKELNLTPAQANLYDDMRKKHFEYTRKLNEESRMLRDSFFEHIKTRILDTVAINALEKKIGAIQFSLDTVTLNHFRRFRAILHPDQQEKFDHIIKNALHLMTGPQPHGRGGRPGPPNGMPPPPDGDHGQGPPPDGPPPPPGN